MTMKLITLTLGAATLSLLVTANPANAQLNKKTQVCADTIVKADIRFGKKIIKGTEKCLDGLRKCLGDVNCITHLLFVGKTGRPGRCANGKLDALQPFLGTGSAILTSDTDKTTIGKAYYKYVETIDAKCFAPEVDLSDSANGLGFNPVPTSKYELADALNRNDSPQVIGVACSALRQVNIDYPDGIDLINDGLIFHPFSGGLAFAPIYFASEVNYYCK